MLSLGRRLEASRHCVLEEELSAYHPTTQRFTADDGNEAFTAEALVSWEPGIARYCKAI